MTTTTQTLADQFVVHLESGPIVNGSILAQANIMTVYPKINWLRLTKCILVYSNLIYKQLLHITFLMHIMVASKR
jgi:hypothetical protein